MVPFSTSLPHCHLLVAASLFALGQDICYVFVGQARYIWRQLKVEIAHASIACHLFHS